MPNSIIIEQLHQFVYLHFPTSRLKDLTDDLLDEKTDLEPKGFLTGERVSLYTITMLRVTVLMSFDNYHS